MTNSERNIGKVSILFSLMFCHLWLTYCKVNKIISIKTHHSSGHFSNCAQRNKMTFSYFCEKQLAYIFSGFQ